MRTLRVSIATLLLASSAYAQRASRPASTDPWEVTELTNRPSLTLELPALNTVRAAGAAGAAGAARAGPLEGRPVLLVRRPGRGLVGFVSAGSGPGAEDNVLTPGALEGGSGGPTPA